MAIVVNPTVPVMPAQGTGAATSQLALQPGTTVNAQVLNVLADNMVQIAIANLAIDVLTEVPLAAGQNLQLSVSQTASGLRLAIVGPNSTAAGAVSDTVTLANAPAVGIASPSAIPAAPVDQLTPLERIAVSVAAETAATQQGSQAPLFANLAAVAQSTNLPPALREAAAQVLAQQTSLDPGLDGQAIQNAFQKSGLFLEASLAAGTLPAAGTVPDLKAALIVLRQALASVGAAAENPVAQPSPLAAAVSASGGKVAPAGTATTAPVEAVPTLVPEIEASAPLQAQMQVPLAGEALKGSNLARIVLTKGAAAGGAQSAVSGAALDLLQPDPKSARAALPTPVAMPGGRSEQGGVHPNPPPPFRGALPSAQPVAAPSIAPNAAPSTVAHRLLDNTDAAIARQTLLQVASLPDRVDAPGQRIDPAIPQWHFEIPFVTPQGTAMAQFEISRDGGGSEVEPAKRVWRARFSLDVEPAGPVHALIAFAGDKTSVRMWAERPATAEQLRAGATELSQALSRAELTPGEIVVANGTPPQATPARAGHFLDRAL